MVFDYLFYDGKPDTGAIIYSLIVQVLKNFKNPVFVCGTEANPIIGHAYMAAIHVKGKFFRLLFIIGEILAFYDNMGRYILSGKFKRIGNKILNKLPKLKRDDVGIA